MATGKVLPKNVMTLNVNASILGAGISQMRQIGNGTSSQAFFNLNLT